MKSYKKRISMLLAATMAGCILFTGCGKTTTTDNSPEAPQATEAPAAESVVNDYPDAPRVEIPEVYTQDASVLESSFLSAGNTERLQNVLNKAASGEPITVAWIGGSITYGYKVKSNECFAYLFSEWLKFTFGTDVNYVNAGISGTPSVLGNLRVERDVLSNDPDLVFVEFAVNDGFEDAFKNSYESLITKILTCKTNPAVCLIFCRTDNGHTCQEWMQEVGKHYDLPMISVVNPITEGIDSNRITWKDYSNDSSHPNKQGHQWITEYLKYAFANIYNSEYEDTHYTLPEKAYYKNYYSAMQLFTKDNLPLDNAGSWVEGDTISDFADGWSYTAEGNDPFTFTADFRGMILLYKEVPDSDTSYGAVDIYIDGELAQTVYSPSAGGWNNPTYNVVYETINSKTHTVEIKAKEGYENLDFEILGFGLMQ